MTRPGYSVWFPKKRQIFCWPLFLRASAVQMKSRRMRTIADRCGTPEWNGPTATCSHLPRKKKSHMSCPVNIYQQKHTTRPRLSSSKSGHFLVRNSEQAGLEFVEGSSRGDRYAVFWKCLNRTGNVFFLRNNIQVPISPSFPSYCSKGLSNSPSLLSPATASNGQRENTP